MELLYCTVAELVEDLKLDGVKSEAGMMKHIRAASAFLTARARGWFLPVTETRKFQARHCGRELLIPPLLSATSVSNDDTALTTGTDYLLWPDGKHWRNGPYSVLLVPSTLGAIGSWSQLTDGVEILGKWGLYEETAELDVNGTLGSAAISTLAVTDGSKLSPGMVLLCESEQMLVEASWSSLVDVSAELDGLITADDLTVTINDGTLVHVGETIKIGFERMKVQDISGDDLLVARGWDGTARAAHADESAVTVQRSFLVKRGANGTTAAVHNNKALYQVRAPEDVNYLCRQIAALMMKKADTGFIGRSGNDELGTGFWVNEFPKNQIEAVMANYVWGGR